MNNVNTSQDSPLISAIVPIYKVEKYLRRCVDSILRQSYRNLEVILVDDGSPDQCGSICDEYAKNDERVVVLNKENGGLSSARNAGIDIAKGQFIGFVDSDDYIDENMYELLYVALKDSGCLLSVCGTTYEFEDGKSIRKTEGGDKRILPFPDALVEMNQYRLFDMAAWSKLYARELFDEIRFPEGLLSEDFFIMYKIFERADKIAYISDPVYHYIQRQNSISRNKKINTDFELAAKAQMEYLDSRHPDLSDLGHTSYASSVLTVYDSYLKSKVNCPKQSLAHFRNVVRENLPHIRRAKFLSMSKRIQFYLFLWLPSIYGIVFKLYKRARPV